MFEVHIFLLHCFLPAPVQVSKDITIMPFDGTGVMDVGDLIDKYLERVLQQPPQPAAQKTAMSEHIQRDGASAVITVRVIEASNHIDAIRKTEETILTCRDILALRQVQRGLIAGFLSIQTDVDPIELYSQVRRPYPMLRKVRNLPIFESESDILARLFQKATKHPLLQVYLSLYADAISYSDSLVTDMSTETRLLKTWSLLEAMASLEAGTKKQKVKALFSRYQMSTYPDYRNHTGKDLLDVAYAWRNVIAHCGGCKAATDPKDKTFCQNFQPDFEAILEDLSESCRMLLHTYANSLP